MLRQRITRSITCIIAIALLAWSLPVAAYDTGAEAPPPNPHDRWNTSVVAVDAEGSTYPEEAPPPDPHDHWNTFVVAVNAEGSTYGLSPEDILSMVAFDAEDSTYGDGLLREDLLAVARSRILADNVNRSVARAQILADNVNRIVSGIFYDAEGRQHLWHLWPMPSEEGVVATDPSAFSPDPCESC